MKKNLIKVTFILSMLLLTLIPLSVNAETSGTCGDNLMWTLDNNGVLTISGAGEMYNFSDAYDIPWYSSHTTITSVVLSEGITRIGKNAFLNCDNLTSVYVPDVSSYLNIAYENYASCPMYYANKLYINNKRAVNVTIPNDVTNIPDYAFFRCTSLSSVEIPESVKKIGQYAFSGCTYLDSVILNDGLESIDQYAFHECSNLTDITVPQSVKTINSFAFNGCNSLKSITLPFIGSNRGGSYNQYHGGPYDVFGYVFGYYLVNTNVVNNPYAQYDYYIPSSLRKVTITNETIVSPYSFEDCSMLTDISINYGITTIGYGAFYDCSGLKSIVIPDSVTYIDEYVFYNCTALTSITIPFVGASRTESSSPSAVFGYLFGGHSSAYTAGTAQQYYDNYTYYYNLVSSINEIIVTDASKIPYGAFYNCSFVDNIILNGGITEIGKNAFYNCKSLTEIDIPDSVTTIGDYAFQGCGGDVVTINSRVIGNYMFYNSEIKKVIIGKKVSSIGERAFANCYNLKILVIPKSITEIEPNTFSMCDSITTVEYEGTEAEWKDIYIGNDNGALKTAQIKYNTTPPVTITYNTKYGTNRPDSQKAEINSTVVISSTTPVKEGYEFLGWSTSDTATNAEYKTNDIITVGTEDITLYAVWKKIICTKTQYLNGIFLVTPTGVENGNRIIFVCYNGDKMVYVNPYIYAGETTIPFSTTKTYDKVKVMVWENLETCVPLCEVENVPLN